jgi:hypothetical protein
MLRVLSIFAVLAGMAGPTAMALPPDNGSPMWKPSTGHPWAHKLVAVNWAEDKHTHGGNGFIWGEGGCFVITNAHNTLSKPDPKNPGKSIPRYLGALEALEDRDNLPIYVAVDLNPVTGQFRKIIQAKLWHSDNAYHDSVRRSQSTAEYIRGDIAIYKLEECLGEEYAVTLCELPREQPQPLGNLYNLHVWKTGELTGKLYTQGPCHTDQTNRDNSVFRANCANRPGMSGSIYVMEKPGGDFCVAGMITMRNEELALTLGMLARRILSHTRTLDPVYIQQLEADLIEMRRQQQGQRP